MTSSPTQIYFGESNTEPEVPVVEIEAANRYEESRTAMAIVAELRERNVPVRDVVVVARELDEYEEPLNRAALRYDLSPAFWTQIKLTETRPYLLVEALCELFAVSEPDRNTLFRPLELGWSPGDTTEGRPIDADLVDDVYRELPSDSRSVEAWQSRLKETELDNTRISDFVDWVAESPEPKPDAVSDVLGRAIETYRDSVLPVQRATDSPALSETETAARAVVQMERLVGQVESKYAQRLADGWTDASWTAIEGMFESLATQRPGRREHANAHAVDILEANDLWAREIRYVIAVGLVDGEWPTRPRSVIPRELQHAILAGEGPAQQLVPRTSWREGRDHDHFIDTVRAAANGLVLTRRTRDVDGSRQRRSPLLDLVDVTPVSQTARQRLLSVERTLPDPICAMLSSSTTEVRSDE